MTTLYIIISIYAYLKWKTTNQTNTLQQHLSSFFFSNLRSQIESQASELLHLVFNDQGSISRHGQNNLVRQVGGFIEQVQVSKSEGKWNWLINFQNSGIILLFTLVTLDSDATTTDFSANGESDRFLRGLDSNYTILTSLNNRYYIIHYYIFIYFLYTYKGIQECIGTCFGDLGHFSADSGELSSAHGDNRAVISFWNAELFTVDGQEVQVELRDLITTLFITLTRYHKQFSYCCFQRQRSLKKDLLQPSW